MQIDIKTRSLKLNRGLRQQIRRKLSYALGGYAEHIQRVIVRLSGGNKLNNGEEQICQIQVVIPHMQDIVIKDRESRIFAAISRAADRTNQTVSRRLKKYRDKLRSTNRRESLYLNELYEA